MELDLTLSLPISGDEEQRLAGILGVEQDTLESRLGSVANAALEEYVRMFLGQKVFTRGSDIREYRLFLLMRRFFGDTIPDEQRVCDLFQTTTTQSRSLVRSVLSKYQYELQEAVDGSLRSLLVDHDPPAEGQDYEVTINSESLVEEFNRILAATDGTLDSVRKKRGAVGTHVIRRSSFYALAEQLELGLELN